VLFQSISLLFRSYADRRYAIPLHGSGLPCCRSALHCSTMLLRLDSKPLQRRASPLRGLALASNAYAVP
jgi:hypothetical protein